MVGSWLGCFLAGLAWSCQPGERVAMSPVGASFTRSTVMGALWVEGGRWGWEGDHHRCVAKLR